MCSLVPQDRSDDLTLLREVRLIWTPSENTALRDKLEGNTKCFREKMTEANFNLLHGHHPIVPVMLGDVALSQKMADMLLYEGGYVIGFFFSVVPKGEVRIRVQLSVSHDRAHLDSVVSAFHRVSRALDIVKT